MNDVDVGKRGDGHWRKLALAAAVAEHWRRRRAPAVFVATATREHAPGLRIWGMLAESLKTKNVQLIKCDATQKYVIVYEHTGAPVAI